MFSQVKQKFGFTQDRFDRAIDCLLKDGLAWEDTQNVGEIAYWFPAYLAQTDFNVDSLNFQALN